MKLSSAHLERGDRRRAHGVEPGEVEGLRKGEQRPRAFSPEDEE